MKRRTSRTSWVACSLLGTICLPLVAATLVDNKDVLQGDWTVASFVANGVNGTPTDLRETERKCTFTAGRVSLWPGEGSFKIDSGITPHGIDIAFDMGENKDKTFLGIYSLQGDELRICLARPGSDRPQAFKSEKGSGRLLIVYRRVKKPA